MKLEFSSEGQEDDSQKFSKPVDYVRLQKLGGFLELI